MKPQPFAPWPLKAFCAARDEWSFVPAFYELSFPETATTDGYYETQAATFKAHGLLEDRFRIEDLLYGSGFRLDLWTLAVNADQTAKNRYARWVCPNVETKHSVMEITDMTASFTFPLLLHPGEPETFGEYLTFGWYQDLQPHPLGI